MTEENRVTDWQICFLKEKGIDVDFNKSQTNLEKIRKLLQDGVLYDDKKRMYWADGENNNCFAIYAKELTIANGNHRKYCQWMRDSNGTGTGIEIAQMMKVNWLKVEGSFSTMDLSRKVWYEVLFLTKMAPSSTMTGQTVLLKLTLPDRTNLVKQEKLPGALSLRNNSWHELKVGEFKMTDESVGKIQFVMEKEFNPAKEGLIIKGVEIRPSDHKDLYKE